MRQKFVACVFRQVFWELALVLLMRKSTHKSKTAPPIHLPGNCAFRWRLSSPTRNWSVRIGSNCCTSSVAADDDGDVDLFEVDAGACCGCRCCCGAFDAWHAGELTASGSTGCGRNAFPGPKRSNESKHLIRLSCAFANAQKKNPN